MRFGFYELMVVPNVQDMTVNLYLLSTNARQFAWLVTTVVLFDLSNNCMR